MLHPPPTLAASLLGLALPEAAPWHSAGVPSCLWDAGGGGGHSGLREPPDLKPQPPTLGPHPRKTMMKSSTFQPLRR